MYRQNKTIEEIKAEGLIEDDYQEKTHWKYVSEPGVSAFSAIFAPKGWIWVGLYWFRLDNRKNPEMYEKYGDVRYFSLIFYLCDTAFNIWGGPWD